jgi:hypothetical protein
MLESTLGNGKIQERSWQPGFGLKLTVASGATALGSVRVLPKAVETAYTVKTLPELLSEARC